MTPDAYGNIHVAVNMLLLVLLEGLCLWGLWHVINSVWIWALLSVPAALLIAFVAHRLIPVCVGPVVDALILDRVEW